MAEKRTRRTRAELREMMLTAGKDVLFEIEPSLGFEELTYSAVFEHLQTQYDQKVTIGSVHERIWPSQRDFQLEVVAAVLRDPVALVSGESATRLAQAISAVPLTTPAERKYAIQNAIRLSSFLYAPDSSPRGIDIAHMVRFRLWAIGHDHPEAEGFVRAVADIRQASTQAYAQVVRAGMQAVRLRVKADAGDPETVINQIAILGNAVLIGLRTDVLPAAHAARPLPTGPNGETEEWFADAIALWAFVRTSFELDDDDLSDDERAL